MYTVYSNKSNSLENDVNSNQSNSLGNDMQSDTSYVCYTTYFYCLQYKVHINNVYL